jgi:phosphoglucomutase
MVYFGTSGWRGVIGRDITFRKVRIVTQAVLDTLRSQGPLKGPFLIGYDTRMLSEKFAATAAKILTSNGVNVETVVRDCPSPVLSSAVRRRGATAGLMFTGSHNAPEYNGLKIYTADGNLAPEDYTPPIEVRYRELEKDWDDVFLPDCRLHTEHDPQPAYLEQLQALIDWEAIRRSGLRLVVDPLFGSTREYLDHILLENSLDASIIHNTRDPFFGGYAPNCSSVNLGRLRDVMRRTSAHLGLATDGDGDRFGILDQGARMCDSSHLIALILDYLARRRGLKGRVGRSLATSTLIDAVAKEHGLEVIETPVGFKSFGPMLVDGTLEFAGEESAGLAWAKHLPERDGLLACLLTVEMVAVEGKTIFDQVHALEERVGHFFFRRTQLPLTTGRRELFERRRRQEWTSLGGRPIVGVERQDGLKLTFEGGAWLLIREAGTEKKFRLYAEGRTGEEMRQLMHQARQMFNDRRL